MAVAPLVVIVGPTASGKTALAIDLARQFDGEIICADSRTVYKGMDIGTAKPTVAEQQGVPHWGLDLVYPNERFTAADFKRYAKQKIDDIRARGKVPFLVGGTGLYVDAVVLDYEFGGGYNQAKRAELETLSLEELYKYSKKNNIKLPENSSNKRYVIRAIEQNNINNRRRNEPIENCIVVGISTNRDTLRTRIESRSEQLFANGMLEEAIGLGVQYGWDSEAMTGNIYRLAHMYANNELSLDEVRRQFITKDWQLAKRQLTWLRRNEFVHWLDLESARIFLKGQLERLPQS